VISIDLAIAWLTWSGFTGACLGLFAGVTLAYAARMEERTPVVIGEQLRSAAVLAAPSAETVRQRRGTT
jgi:hypothetical protein